MQTFLVPIGASSNEQSDLLRHFGLSAASALPVIAWVRKDAALSFEMASASLGPLSCSDAPAGGRNSSW